VAEADDVPSGIFEDQGDPWEFPEVPLAVDEDGNGGPPPPSAPLPALPPGPNQEPKVYAAEGPPPPPLPPVHTPVVFGEGSNLPGGGGNARRSAGITLLTVAAGAGIGALFGGAWGAGAGAFTFAAFRNGWRAKSTWGSTDEAVHAEAVKSMTVSVVGLGIGGYCAYRAHKLRNED